MSASCLKQGDWLLLFEVIILCSIIDGNYRQLVKLTNHIQNIVMI
ncbi:hypothetical protein SALWKB29_0586 [Snodgrassella communis]|uniref:Uncharacterized protein n=1 Tax=Snodgrassella communis TaxID=2946699 RepID=A0A836MST9_9NEIS|nr:hypothetical protein SALWKB29_0586 [Snodgrassella communis]